MNDRTNEMEALRDFIMSFPEISKNWLKKNVDKLKGGRTMYGNLTETQQKLLKVLARFNQVEYAYARGDEIHTLRWIQKGSTRMKASVTYRIKQSFKPNDLTLVVAPKYEPGTKLEVEVEGPATVVERRPARFTQYSRYLRHNYCTVQYGDDGAYRNIGYRHGGPDWSEVTVAREEVPNPYGPGAVDARGLAFRAWDPTLNRPRMMLHEECSYLTLKKLLDSDLIPMQYAGVPDIYGKYLAQGDVVEGSFGIPITVVRAVVELRDGVFGIATTQSPEWCDLKSAVEYLDLERIGDICRNPELMAEELWSNINAKRESEVTGGDPISAAETGVSSGTASGGASSTTPGR